MAKDKSLKPDRNLSKRKKLASIASEVNVEEMKDTKVQKKKKKREDEEGPVPVPHVTMTADDKKRRKEKKRKKKQMKEQTQRAEQVEISDLPCHPDGAQVPEGEEDLSPEERRILERKMKKILKKEEKERIKAAGKTPEKASGPTAPQQAIDYLTCWAENRTEWRFQKTRQTWLLQHMFDSEKIPDNKFSSLLEYLEGLRGGARDTTVKKAMVLVEESGQAPEDGVVQQRAHRAREVIQLLS